MGGAAAPSLAVDAPVQPSGSALKGFRAAGAFVVTAEFPPPDSADPAEVLARLEPFRGCVDALNVTTLPVPTATCRVSRSRCCSRRSAVSR